jgi:hypothetical protein
MVAIPSNFSPIFHKNQVIYDYLMPSYDTIKPFPIFGFPGYKKSVDYLPFDIMN